MRRVFFGSMLVALYLGVLPFQRAAAERATPQAGPNSVYLPMMARAGTSTPPPTTTPPTTTPPPVDESGALFMQPDKKTAGASLKVDAQGGMHIVYYNAIPLR